MMTPSSDTFWHNYVIEAMTFAVLPAAHRNARNEASLGLIEEAGEVAGIFKRAARGDYGGELDLDKLTKELGDLLWYIVRAAIVTRDYSVEVIVSDLEDYELAAPNFYDLQQVAQHLAMIGESSAMRQIRILFGIAKNAGVDLREVATKNLEKLRARRSAGTIQGSGDNR